MKLKLQLVRDGEIVFDVPLAPMGEPQYELVSELDAFEEHFQRLSKIFNALSNETRLMMMKQLIEKRNHIISFSDFMRDLDLNPKLVWENTRKLGEGGTPREDQSRQVSLFQLRRNRFHPHEPCVTTAHRSTRDPQILSGR